MLDDVTEYLHLGVLVALPQDPALALFDVRGPPRTIQEVKRDRPRLDVGPDAHLLGRADQHRELPVAGGGEQPALLNVALRFVDVADLMARDAETGELVAELVVGVPAIVGVPRSQNTICKAPVVGERSPVSGS